MQAKVFGGVFALMWSGMCFQAGKLSEKQNKDTYTTDKVEIQIPQRKGGVITGSSLQSTQKSNDTFTDSLIQEPFRRISYPNFKILYSTYHRCPLAVHEKVTKLLADGNAPRKPTFFVQEGIQPQFRATNDHFVKSGAYKNFNFSRGHMAAAGNYSGNKQAKFQTFTYANVVPQNHHNNGGIWNTFERYSRELLMNQKCESVQIINGPIYYKNGPYEGPNGERYQKVFKEQSIVLLENGVVAPQKLYKIIKCNTKTGQSYLNAFQFWNKKTFENDKPLKQFVTSLQSVENQTGLKFNFGKDQLAQPVLFKSLIQFDKQGFQTTKKAYDLKFYMNMMHKAYSVQDLNNSFMRAKQQQLFIPLEEFAEQTQNLFKKDMQEIKKNFQKNPAKTACWTLSKLMKLNKSLFYLRQLTPEHEQQIKQSQENGPIQQCIRKANDLRSKKWEDFYGDDQDMVIEKKQKTSLNSLNYAITKSLNKQEQIIKQKAAPAEQVLKYTLSYVNEDKLKQLVIPVNIAVSIVAQKKFTQAQTQTI